MNLTEQNPPCDYDPYCEPYYRPQSRIDLKPSGVADLVVDPFTRAASLSVLEAVDETFEDALNDPFYSDELFFDALLAAYFATCDACQTTADYFEGIEGETPRVAHSIDSMIGLTEHAAICVNRWHTNYFAIPGFMRRAAILDFARWLIVHEVADVRATEVLAAGEDK